MVLAKLLRHLHGDPQDLGLWEVVQGEAWVLSHPEHGQWKSEPAHMLQHLRAVEVRAALVRQVDPSMTSAECAWARQDDDGVRKHSEEDERRPGVRPQVRDEIKLTDQGCMAQRSPTTTARVLHIDRQIQYTVERTAAGLVLEVMVSHGHAWYPVTVALSAAERQDWIVQGPSSTRELAEALLADEKGFMQSRGER